jgi:chitosanase
MPRLIVKAKLLNKRSFIPAFLPEPNGLTGIVKQNFIFEGEEVTIVPNPALGKWYRDRDNHFYWGGALDILEAPVDEQAPELTAPDNAALETISITPLIKKKIEQVINAFETGSAEGNYGTLVKLKDYEDPATHTRIVQVTFGRSQTTEFGHLKSLIEDYVTRNGKFAAQLKPYLQRIGNKPSLATDTVFCDTLKEAGRNDPIMKVCQDELFDAKYYQPAHSWFTANKFTLPLSLLVIYDSKIHSGGILGFLRKKFSTNVPASGGNEKEWIANYVNARHNWLSGHSDPILRKTVYRTECFRQEIQKGNWDLSESINAHGVKIV